MALFNRNLTTDDDVPASVAEEVEEVMFGIVKSADKFNLIGAIDNKAVGKMVGCFVKHPDGEIDKLAEIKVDIDMPSIPDLGKVKLYPVAENDTVNPRELKNYKPDEVFVQAFLGKEAVGDPFPVKLLELCFPEAQPDSAPTPDPIPTPEPTPAPTPASPTLRSVDISDDYLLFYKPGTPEEELCEGKYEYWLECLERGFAKSGEFEYRIPRTVLGRVVASDNKSDVQFRIEHLKEALK